MELQAESERIKRSKILNSEGERQGLMNVAEGEKRSFVLEGEGAATKIYQEARAVCESLDQICQSVGQDGDVQALKLKLAERYLEAMNQILDESKVLILPKEGGSSGGVASMVATSMQLYKEILGANPDAGITGRVGEESGHVYSQLQAKVREIERENRELREKMRNSNPGHEFYDDRTLYSTE